MDGDGRWSVEFYHFASELSSAADEQLAGFGDLRERAARNSARHGTPVMVGPSGYPDPRVNLFFRTGAMSGAVVATWRRYAFTLLVWLEFLRVFGRSWDQAAVADVEAFKDWRLTDMRNYGRVLPSSFDTYRAALNTFYTWAAARYDVFNPVPTVGRRGLGLYGLAMGRPVGIRCGAGGIRSDRPGQHGGR